jgi:hypothetical protein
MASLKLSRELAPVEVPSWLDAPPRSRMLLANVTPDESPVYPPPGCDAIVCRSRRGALSYFEYPPFALASMAAAQALFFPNSQARLYMAAASFASLGTKDPLK